MTLPTMLTLYDSRLSLNCYKVRLLLSILKLPYSRQPVDLRKAEHRTAEFLSRNAFGQVPVLCTGEAFIRDSTTILIWLARTQGAEQWLPREPTAEAEVNAWLQASAFELRIGPYDARLKRLFPGLCVTGDAVDRNTERALKLCEARLSVADWLALDRPTLADIASFPSLAHCGDGGVDLAPYPAIRCWLDRVRSLDGFVELLA